MSYTANDAEGFRFGCSTQDQSPLYCKEEETHAPVDWSGGRSTKPVMSDFMHVSMLGFSPG